ncbi:MAG: rhodanese-like domain-containing protein [Methanohalobium sp.]|uniref:rhodanese-like domain-containing protein n=1 Tax=Methanohalobium sp. TaxID=2837493 RepID=UPI00397A572E
MKIGCSTEDVTKISPNKLKQILDSDREGDFVVVDVRQPEEYEQGHLPGAKLIPLDELDARYDELDKTKNIITYCRAGRRSLGAATHLCGLGFKNVYTMDGGFLEWNYKTLSGFPEEKPEFIAGNEEIDDILLTAIKLEKGSQDFYLKSMNSGEVSSDTKETLDRLARIEEKHIDKLYRRYANITDEEIPPLEVLKKELDFEYMEGGIKISKELLKNEEIFKDEIDVLETAIEKEYLSFDFYKRMAEVMSNKDTRKLLHELANEEKNHINYLINSLKQII